MTPRPCAACPAIGDTWPYRGRMLCDTCLTRIETQRVRELPPGEERRPLPWASWETRPITEREASKRQRFYAPAGNGRLDTFSLIQRNLDGPMRKHTAKHDRASIVRAEKNIREALPEPKQSIASVPGDLFFERRVPRKSR